MKSNDQTQLIRMSDQDLLPKIVFQLIININQRCISLF